MINPFKHNINSEIMTKLKLGKTKYVENYTIKEKYRETNLNKNMMKEYVKEIVPRAKDEKVTDVLKAELSESEDESLNKQFNQS